jgi:hypothetical protein
MSVPYGERTVDGPGVRGKIKREPVSQSAVASAILADEITDRGEIDIGTRHGENERIPGGPDPVRIGDMDLVAAQFEPRKPQLTPLAGYPSRTIQILDPHQRERGRPDRPVRGERWVRKRAADACGSRELAQVLLVRIGENPDEMIEREFVQLQGTVERFRSVTKRDEAQECLRDVAGDEARRDGNRSGPRR